MAWAAVCGSVSNIAAGRTTTGADKDQKMFAPSQASTASMLNAASLPSQGIRAAAENRADMYLTVIVWIIDSVQGVGTVHGG